MKNKYFGDVGDFGKFGLLTALSAGPLKLGVNWYLTRDDYNSDGNHIEYFNKPDFLTCDQVLHNFLKNCIINNQRRVSELSKLSRFAETPFYEEILDIEGVKALSESGRREREKRRAEWFEESLTRLARCNLIFCDPDNGIETKSLSKTGKDSVKYTFKSEINSMIDNGFSLVIYNHRDRSTEVEYKRRIADIYNAVSYRTKMRVLRFNRYSVRDYIILMQNEHYSTITSQLDSFVNAPTWSKHFEEIDI